MKSFLLLLLAISVIGLYTSLVFEIGMRTGIEMAQEARRHEYRSE